jgi:hypothetical protein
MKVALSSSPLGIDPWTVGFVTIASTPVITTETGKPEELGNSASRCWNV